MLHDLRVTIQQRTKQEPQGRVKTEWISAITMNGKVEFTLVVPTEEECAVKTEAHLLSMLLGRRGNPTTTRDLMESQDQK